jgi:hypothetical protein
VATGAARSLEASGHANAASVDIRILPDPATMVRALNAIPTSQPVAVRIR